MGDSTGCRLLEVFGPGEGGLLEGCPLQSEFLSEVEGFCTCGIDAQPDDPIDGHDARSEKLQTRSYKEKETLESFLRSILVSPIKKYNRYWFVD